MSMMTSCSSDKISYVEIKWRLYPCFKGRYSKAIDKGTDGQLVLYTEIHKAYTHPSFKFSYNIEHDLRTTPGTNHRRDDARTCSHLLRVFWPLAVRIRDARECDLF